MIDVAYFEPRDTEAARVLGALSAGFRAITGRECQARLLPHLDDRARARILELDDEVFGNKRDVFDAATLDEMEADPDALLLVIEIEGTIEACVFGYYEEPRGQIVEDTDFFIDSAMVSRAWQHRGIGELGGAAILLLLEIAEDVDDVGVAVWSDGDVEQLVSLYRRLGFVDASGRDMPHRCMRVALDDDLTATMRNLLGLPAPVPQPSR